MYLLYFFNLTHSSLHMQVTAQPAAKKVLGYDLTLDREIPKELIRERHVPWDGDVGESLTMSRNYILGSLLRADQFHQALVFDNRVLAQASIDHIRVNYSHADLEKGRLVEIT